MTTSPLLLLLLLPLPAAAVKSLVSGNWSCTAHIGTDYQCHPHNCDLATHGGVLSAAACCALCSSSPLCYAAAWNGPKFKTCYLKGEGATPQVAAPSSPQGSF